MSKGRHRRPSRAAGIASTAAGTASAGIAASAIMAAPAHAAVTSAPHSSVQPAPVRAVADTIRATQPLTVTVQSGDTLAKIARDHCGNPAMWTGIYKANEAKIKNYDLIYPGQVLTVACAIKHVAPQVTYVPRHAVTTVTASQPARSAPVTESNVSTAGMGGFQACVIRAESGGNPQIWNPSGHWGLYQFSEQTWVGHGGSAADFGKAGAAEQTQVFWQTVHDDGTRDWAPYDGC